MFPVTNTLALKFILFFLSISLIFSNPFSNNDSDTLQTKRMVTQPNLPIDSVATSDDITALYFNPAGLGYHPFQAGYYYGNNPEDKLQDSTLFFNVLGFAFSSQWRLGEDNQYARRLSVGQSFIQSRFFSAGTSYSWYNSNASTIDNYTHWDMGFMFRPMRYLSAGAVVRALNQPAYQGETVLPYWDLGLALRPIPHYTELLTFSIDTTWYQEENYENLIPRYTIEIQPTSGMNYYAGWDNYQNIFFGVHLPIESLRSSFQVTVPKDQGTFYSAGAIIGKERFPGSISRPGLKRILIIPLGEDYPESEPASFFFHRGLSFTQLMIVLERARNDANIKAILLKGGEFRGGWAQAEEIHRELVRIGNRKPVYTYLENADTKTYYIASASDKISMPAAASLELGGLRAGIYYLGDTFGKVGVEANFVKIGKYKTAPEVYERNQISSAEREQTSKLLENMNEVVSSAIVRGRNQNGNNLNREQLSNIHSQALITAENAKDLGLIDYVEYFEDLKEREFDSVVLDNFKYVGLERYAKTTDYDDSWGIKPAIAVVILDGTIARNTNALATTGISFPQFQEQLKGISSDTSLRALVIRINSPGGTALESDLIWKEIMNLREKREDLPVIISIGDVAASGGYYIATAGDYLMASNMSVTGSIGIYAGKFSFQELFKKAGIKKETLKTAEHADMFSEARPFTPEEREILSHNLESFYNLFLDRVEKSSGLPREEVERLAQGRVYSGTHAQEERLLNQGGGILPALQLAMQRGHVSSKYVDIKLYSTSPGRFSILSNAISTVMPSFSRDIAQRISETDRMREENIFFLLPYEIEIH